MMNISEKVFEIVQRNVGLNTSKKDVCVTLESRLADDLGMDSLSRVESVMALEDTFCIQIDEDDATKFTTVQDVISYVAHKVQEDKTSVDA